MTEAHAPAKTAERSAFYGKIGQAHCTPLWEVLSNIVTAKPNTPCLPHLWKWEEVWPWLMEAGGLISAMEAERRVLVLENPGLRGRTRITHSLYAGLQLIMPGEIAPSHRHSQSALRFIVKGSGAYTTVADERVMMAEGDFVITPSWTFHEHGNPSSEPMVWLDGLDLPIVELLDAQFREDGPRTEAQAFERTSGTNLARFGNTMKPVGYKSSARTSPLFWYPYARTREALETLSHHEDPHPCWGHKLQYTNPLTGEWAIPTIGTFMQWLPAGFVGKSYRSTDSTVYSVVEGSGNCFIEGKAYPFVPKDVFVCPSWMPYRLESSSGAVLFSYSDRPVQQVLDLWREQFS